MRFEIFKRDKFSCQYCGSTPPDALLECDHIVPKCEGGGDEYTNLITACFDCNRGKGGRKLDEDSTESVQKMQLEKIAQLAAFNKLLIASIDARSDQSKWLVDKVAELLNWNCLTDTEEKSLRVFERRLNIDEILEAAEITGSRKIHSNSARWRFFCGVCWRKIKKD